MMIKVFGILSFFYFLTNVAAYADKPEWINRLPFTDDAFWGMGEGKSMEESQLMAKRDILMQMSSKINAVITTEERNDAEGHDAVERMEIFFTTNTLRGAVLSDKYIEGNTYWTLMKYGDECGKILINSALNRFENEYDYKSEEIMERIDDEKVMEALMLERRLRELRLEDYRSEDISVVLRQKNIVLTVINFLPEEAVLSDRQRQGLIALSGSLFKELTLIGYSGIDVIGHANPTGKLNEEEELTELSKNRANTMASYLRSAGLRISSIGWKGGENPIGDTGTAEGRGRNRRVEIVIRFE